MTPRRIAAVIALAAGCTAACTPTQVAKWVTWYEQDPTAALEYANRPEVQAQLAERAASSTNSEQDVRRGDVWDRLAECESGQSWSYNGGSGYDGGLQFAPSTWRGFGGEEFAPFAHQATREQQIVVAQRVLESQGWRAWPACSRKLGLR